MALCIILIFKKLVKIANRVMSLTVKQSSVRNFLKNFNVLTVIRKKDEYSSFLPLDRAGDPPPPLAYSSQITQHRALNFQPSLIDVNIPEGHLRIKLVHIKLELEF